MMTLREMVREERENIGLTQRDVAKRAGLTQAELSQVLTRKRPLKPIYAARLERVLKVSAEELMLAEMTEDLEDARATLEEGADE